MISLFPYKEQYNVIQCSANNRVKWHPSKVCGNRYQSTLLLTSTTALYEYTVAVFYCTHMTIKLVTVILVYFNNLVGKLQGLFISVLYLNRREATQRDQHRGRLSESRTWCIGILVTKKKAKPDQQLCIPGTLSVIKVCYLKMAKKNIIKRGVR